MDQRMRELKQHLYCLEYLEDNGLPAPNHQRLLQENKIKITLLRNRDIRNWIHPVIVA